MSSEDCAGLKARIDALDARIDAVLLGQDVKKTSYGGRSVEMSGQPASLAELRARKAELERRYRACGCTPVLDEASAETGRRAIRPVMR